MQTQNIEENLFEQHMAQNVEPLIFGANKIKERYRSRFWGSLWTMLFLVCANTLFVLFATMIYDKPFSGGQLLLVAVAAVLIVLWPLWRYKKQSFPDIFAAFIKFYGHWQYQDEPTTIVADSKEDILPSYDQKQIVNVASGSYFGAEIVVADTIYQRKNKKIGAGIAIDIILPQKSEHNVLLFAKNGHFRKNKREGMTLINEQIYIPAAAYFNIFSATEYAPKKLLCSPFFEAALDVRDAFKARKMSFSLQGQRVLIYLEDCVLYREQNGLWQPKIKTEKFTDLHQKFSEIFKFVELLQELAVREL